MFSKPTPKYLLSLFVLSALSQTAACSNAAMANPTEKTAVVTEAYQMQVLKDCKVQSERALTPKEVQLYHELQLAEQQMKRLEVPLQQMEAELTKQSKTLEKLSSQIEQQAWQQGGPDPELLKAQAEFSQRINAVVDRHQGDIDAVSSQGNYIAQVAGEFEQLTIKPLDKDTFDQIRIYQQGEPVPTDCQQGMFFATSSVANRS
jgi:small-conductance mechanosensitive channel